MAPDNGHPVLRPLGGAAFFTNKEPREARRPARFNRKSGSPPAGQPARRQNAVAQRTFSVASPIIARISEMIQKRITMVGSAQPFFS